MMKLLNIIPKDLRIYIREGVIFNNIKIIKSLWRKACKENLNGEILFQNSSSESLEKYSKIFIHLPLLIKVIVKCGEKEGIPINNEHVMEIFEKYLGKGQCLVMISALETIFQCQLSNEFLGTSQKDPQISSKIPCYNFKISTLNINANSKIEEIILLCKETLIQEKNASNIMKEGNSDQETERIKDMYIRQITRVLRLIYFISLKCQEQYLYQLRSLRNITPEDLKDIDIKLFMVSMRLSAFDDMDNYNKTMKTSLKLLSIILKSNKQMAEKDMHEPLLRVFKAHFRSDLIHRRIKPVIESLKSEIDTSTLPRNIQEEFITILNENL